MSGMAPLHIPRKYSEDYEIPAGFELGEGLVSELQLELKRAFDFLAMDVNLFDLAESQLLHNDNSVYHNGRRIAREGIVGDRDAVLDLLVKIIHMGVVPLPVPSDLDERVVEILHQQPLLTAAHNLLAAVLPHGNVVPAGPPFIVLPAPGAMGLPAHRGPVPGVVRPPAPPPPAPRGPAPGAMRLPAQRGPAPGALRPPAPLGPAPGAMRPPAPRGPAPGAIRPPAPRGPVPGAIRPPAPRGLAPGAIRPPAPRPPAPGAMRPPAPRPAVRPVRPAALRAIRPPPPAAPGPTAPRADDDATGSG